MNLILLLRSLIRFEKIYGLLHTVQVDQRRYVMDLSSSYGSIFFGFVQPDYSRASALGISMVVGVFVEIPKKGQMLYLELHLDYCRH